MVCSTIEDDAYNGVLCPLSHAFHILGIVLLGYVYIHEQTLERGRAEEELIALNAIATTISQELDMDRMLNAIIGVPIQSRDGDGVSLEAGNCDDSNPAICPGIKETGNNGVDDNCDGVIVELWPAEYRFGDPAPGYSYASWPLFESWMNVRIENRGTADARNVRAEIVSAPPNTTVPDPSVYLGDIPLADGSAWSVDPDATFTTMVNVAYPDPVDPCAGVTWNILYGDAAGEHVIENVSQYAPGEGPCAP
jgi:hypothetical protein